MTQPANGEWYLATDGKWYCWPDPTPHDEPPAAPAAPPSPGFAAPMAPEAPTVPGMPAMPPAPGAPVSGSPGYGAPSSDYGVPAGYAATRSDGRGPAVEANRTAAWLTIAGGALCAVGSLLPWAKVQSLFITLSPNGMDGGDGVITLILGVVAALVGVGAIARWSLPPWTVWVPVAACAVAGLLAIANIVDVKNIGDDLPDGAEGLASVSVGSGLYVIVVGAILGIVGGVLLRRRD
jgi:hypothetical protein